jgi:hypothetical protein
MARQRSPKVSRDGRFFWNETSQAWEPLPPQPPAPPPPKQRLSCCGIPVLAIIILVVAYLLIHGVWYHACTPKPGTFDWPGNCPSGGPFGL